MIDPTPLDGLGIFNAIHEYAETHGSNTRYDREPGPMGWWAAKHKKGVLPDFTAEVVEHYSDSDNNYGDEHYQGWTGKCFLIFKITPNNGGPPVFYRFEGVVDSYDGEHWDGKFLPVSPRVENVTVYNWDESNGNG